MKSWNLIQSVCNTWKIETKWEIRTFVPFLREFIFTHKKSPVDWKIFQSFFNVSLEINEKNDEKFNFLTFYESYSLRYFATAFETIDEHSLFPMIATNMTNRSATTKASKMIIISWSSNSSDVFCCWLTWNWWWAGTNWSLLSLSATVTPISYPVNAEPTYFPAFHSTFPTFFAWWNIL